jgi:DNA-binding GntR family transcriptional regulator
MQEDVHLYVYRSVLENIIDGTYAPGRHLVEEDLAKSYGVSRTPVREVLLALQKDGLVERKRNCGARVASFTAEDVEELFEIRKALEVHCIPAVVRTVKLSELLAFEHKLVSLDGGFGPEWRSEHAALDLRLHHMIVVNACNRRLAAYVRNLQYLISSLQVVGFRGDAQVHETGRQHLEILRAILRREADTAQKLLAAHIDFGKRNALELFIRVRSSAGVPVMT